MEGKATRKKTGKMKKQPLKVFSEERASNDFEIAVTAYGTYCSVECDHCGRTFFVNNDKNDYAEGELESLLENHKKQPDKYMISEFDSISHGVIDGKTWVIECVCNAGKRYEDWLIDHRSLIAAFFGYRAKKLMAMAKLEVEDSETINQITKV